MALVRYLSTGDFFQYLSGRRHPSGRSARRRPPRARTSRQDAALQAEMLQQAMNLGVDGIILQHGLTETLKEPAAEAVKHGFKVVAFDVNCENPEHSANRAEATVSLPVWRSSRRSKTTAILRVLQGRLRLRGRHRALDRRDETWQASKKNYPGINEVARRGTLSDPIANSVADQTAAVLRAHPEITVIFAPCDEFAKGVKTAVDRRRRSRPQSADRYLFR